MLYVSDVPNQGRIRAETLPKVTFPRNSTVTLLRRGVERRVQICENKNIFEFVLSRNVQIIGELYTSVNFGKY